MKKIGYDFEKIGSKTIGASYSNLYKHGQEVNKIFDESDKINKQCIQVVIDLINNKEKYSKIEELVLPNDLIYEKNTIVGYSMPYIDGQKLSEYLKEISINDIKKIFIELYHLIYQVDKLGLNIGDLQEENIIIDNMNRIRIIDCDTFIINHKNLYYSNNQKFLGRHISIATTKYENFTFLFHNINSDYFCLFITLLNYVLSVKNVRYVDLYMGVKCDDEILQNLIEETNINEFNMSITDMIHIINNIENINFYNQYLDKRLNLVKN